jgi:hypothetical protein
MGNHWYLLVSPDTAEANPLQDAPDDAFLSLPLLVVRRGEGSPR